MKTILTAIAIITATLITATDTEASPPPEGKWEYRIEVDEFNDTQVHKVWYNHIAEDRLFSSIIFASCAAGTFQRFQFYSGHGLDDLLYTMRVRIDDLVEEIPIDARVDRISILNNPDIETITEGMLSAKKVAFEIFTKGLYRNVVLPDLEGFREVWEHVKPHCYP